ncbi:MAG TPA: chromosome segregation protein SMC [Blastocatellia bacterium]|nr:chromosome segregation protein SMC [Blastocatellia bacterium]
MNSIYPVMLKIEKVQIQGFKSFCDSTEIVFDQTGITAVVGPNGCGKSNVADAINWVIGEQKARALRGRKMEDVIFQGSRNRPPAGMAEVLLTLVVQEEFCPGTMPSQNPLPSTDLLSAEGDGHSSQYPVSAHTSAHTSANGYAAGAPSDLNFQFRQFRAGERFVIGRRLYRSGESEYELNGKPCRLRDIQELFAGTGLSGAHYAIIEQGRVGQILSAKPLERRTLIEEAAGISRFRLRQHAAELKLEASRQNLSRITDIIAEVERQHNALRRQASKARKYQRLRDEMRHLMRTVYATEYLSTRSRIRSLQTRLNSIQEQEADQQKKAADLEAAQRETAHLVNQIESEASDARQQVSELTFEAERTRQQKVHLTEQLRSTTSRSSEQEQERNLLVSRREIIEQEILRLSRDIRQIEEEISHSSRILMSDEKENASAQERLSATETRLDELRQGTYESATQLERWRQLERQFTDTLERHRQKITGLLTEKERAGRQLSETLEQQRSVNASLSSVHSEHTRLTGLLSETEDELTSCRNRKQLIEARLSDTRNRLTAAEHRLLSLSEIDRKKTPFTEAVQEIIRLTSGNGNNTPLPHVSGTLADFIHVPAEYESTVELALKEELQYVLVQQMDDALAIINLLNTSEHGRVGLLITGPQQNNTPEPSPGASGEIITNNYSHSQQIRLLSLLGLSPGLSSILKKALPQLADAVVVNTMTEAIECSAVNASTLFIAKSGERVMGGTFVAGGSHLEKGTGILALKREISELSLKAAELRDEMGTTESELADLNIQAATLAARRSELDSQIRNIERTLPVLQEQLQQGERERERIENWLNVIEKERLQAESEVTEYSHKLEQAATAATAAAETQAVLEREILSVQGEVTRLRQEAEEIRSRLASSRAELAAGTERRRAILNDLRRLEDESREYQNRLARQEMAALQEQVRIAEITASLSALDTRTEELEAEKLTASAHLEEITVRLSECKRRAEELDEQTRAVRNTQAALRDERGNLEIEIARHSSTLQHLSENCRNDLNEEIETVSQEQETAGADDPSLTHSPGISRDRYQTLDIEEEEEESDLQPAHQTAGADADTAKSRLAALREKIDKMGPVNLVALEELSQTAERLDFLLAQKSDIENALADTQSAINEIKRRSKERFREAFNTINANFSQTFRELFGGGHGEMTLIDENDLLESGIEIIAQPPGKRLQNVLLLSGGEKAMTAIALVMAIFKYRPSPFCLLDEVDAPLDEINIGRFADKITEMSRQTQFMIITHNKRTMEAAGTLYGVTMEDPGVSRLVSVRLS